MNRQARPTIPTTRAKKESVPLGVNVALRSAGVMAVRAGPGRRNGAITAARGSSVAHVIIGALIGGRKGAAMTARASSNIAHRNAKRCRRCLMLRCDFYRARRHSKV